jgi:hypothetical protein
MALGRRTHSAAPETDALIDIAGPLHPVHTARGRCGAAASV